MNQTPKDAEITHEEPIATPVFMPPDLGELITSLSTNNIYRIGTKIGEHQAKGVSFAFNLQK